MTYYGYSGLHAAQAEHDTTRIVQSNEELCSGQNMDQKLTNNIEYLQNGSARARHRRKVSEMNEREEFKGAYHLSTATARCSVF